MSEPSALCDQEPTYGGRKYLEKQNLIIEAQKQRPEETEAALEEATIQLHDVDALINEVTEYTYPDELLTPINEAIKRQNKKMRVISQKRTFTETSKDRVIESLKQRIQSSKEDNKKLKIIILFF